MRRFIALILCAVPVFADEFTNSSVALRVQKAVRAGLEVLAANQQENGAWNAIIGRKVHNEYRGRFGPHVGVTSLACMSFMAGGSLPGRGRYGGQVERGLDFVLKYVGTDDGFISAHDSRMYSHAFATLFLSEVYGSTGDPRVQNALSKAVALIAGSQNSAGAWRYMPGQPDADMCVTVCQVQALRSARNAGIYVPKGTIDAAIGYVKRSWDPRTGGFFYQIGVPSRVSFALTAAGLTALYGAGYYEGREIQKGLQYLAIERPAHYRASRTFDFYYGHYYAIQAAFQRGGSYWKEWRDKTIVEMLQNQNSNGSWTDLVGVNYATAMATLILQIPYQYLPIFER